jgi:hypothetical protein
MDHAGPGASHQSADVTIVSRGEQMSRRAMKWRIQCSVLTLVTLMALLVNASGSDADSCPGSYVASKQSFSAAQPSHTLHQSETGEPFTPAIQQLQWQIQAIAPFISIDRQGIQRVAWAEALRAGLGADAVVLGQRLVRLHNRIAMAVKRQERLSTLAPDFAFIAPFFRYEAQLGILSHCDGFGQPTACPVRVPSNQCFSSEETTVQHLSSLGYHQTADYAGGTSGRDYTLIVPDPACGSGPLRSQAIINQAENLWTYNTQGPEPNPEIFGALPGEVDEHDYDWPHFWWGVYVFWWHAFYC